MVRLSMRLVAFSAIVLPWVTEATLQKYAQHLQCPFASLWLEHGPEKAAKMLNLNVDAHARRHLESSWGRCTYTNQFAGGEMCFEFRGATWDDASAKARCDNAMPGAAGTLGKDMACPKSDNFAGWCMTNDGKEAGTMDKGGMAATCKAVADGCVQWSQGTFKEDGVCAQKEEKKPWGSCKYTNQFAGGEMCFEFRGATWDDASAKARCDNAMPGTAGTLGKDVACPKSDNFAGWCMTNDGKEAGTMDKGGMAATCKAVADGCVQWSQGTFKEDGVCAQDKGKGAAQGSGDAPAASAAPTAPCAITPGPAGAAHQHSSSPGYSNDCAGTPGQQSPWMWPLKWSAHVHSYGFKFGSDVPTSQRKSKVWYMLDKNWKRMDGLWHMGQQFFDESADPDQKTTILHRQNKMWFIDYSDDFKTISNCTWMDLTIIGNIRPDWFLDDRGDSTDVQYIGNEHVYHMGVPRLVKKWRKMDFANQYFTMSMQAIPGNDTIHWPLVLNIPGEGFGDDGINEYSNHKLLSESDEAHFFLDEAYEASGGTCIQRVSHNSGPPTHLEHVPSNLEREKVSWRKALWTGSPVWTAPEPSALYSAAPEVAGGKQEVGKNVHVQVCWDEATSTMGLDATFDLGAEAWAAIAWREEESCLMTPRDGTDGEVVYAVPTSTGAFEMMFGPISRSLKTFDSSSIGSFVSGLKGMPSVSDFSDFSGSFADGKVELKFKRKYDKKPDNFYLNYAYGHDKEFKYHKGRGCFEAQPISCDAMNKDAGSDECPACPTCRFELDGVKGPVEAADLQASTAEWSTKMGAPVSMLLTLLTYMYCTHA